MYSRHIFSLITSTPFPDQIGKASMQIGKASMQIGKVSMQIGKVSMQIGNTFNPNWQYFLLSLPVRLLTIQLILQYRYILYDL